MKISLFLLVLIIVLRLPFSVRGREWINQTNTSDTISRSKEQVTGTDGSRNNVNGTTTSDTTSRSIEQVTGTDGSRNNVNGTITSGTTSRRMKQVTGTDVSRNMANEKLSSKRTPLKKTTHSDQQTSTYPNMLEDECSPFGGCEPPEFVVDWYCYCDEKCKDYRDCCQKHNLTENIAQNRYKCMKINSQKNKGFQAISMCVLTYYDDTIKDKCLEDNMIENGPPVADYKNVDIFKNKYCAICNNVTDYIPFAITFYNTKMTAEEMEQFQNLTTKSKLSFLFTDADYELIPPPGVEVRTCVAESLENSHPLCKKYVNPIVQIDGRNFVVYRNSFCIFENERQMNMLICFADLLRIFWQTVEVHSLSVIFSFREPKAYVQDVNHCKEWSIEIERSNMCSQFEIYVNFDIRLVYYMVSTRNHTDKELIRIGLLSVWPLSITNFTQYTRIEIRASESKTIVKVDVTLKVLKKVFIHEKRLVEKSFYERTINLIIRDNETESLVYIENRKDIVGMVNHSVQFNRICRLVFINLKERNPYLIFLSQLQYNDIYTDVRIDKFCIDQQITVNVLSDGAFNVDTENVHCRISNVIRNDKSSPNWSVSAIMTYICFSVSIISLVILIVFNRKHELYTSIPGSNLENLSISLLLSNLLFILGIGASSIPRLCYVVGVTLHFLWLTVFAFMSIAVVYIMSNLLAIKSRREVQKRELVRKRRYITVVGILFPLLIVVSGIVIDQTGPDYWSLGYGGSVCFPNQYPSNVILFSGPVVLSVGVDFVCLSYIIIQVCRVRLELRHIRKLNIYQDAQIYLRIVALSGVFWITGIISAIYELQWLDVLFTILCGLQGFAVVVANINTSRVQSLKSEPIETNDKGTKT